MMTITAAENKRPTTTTKAIKRLREMHPVKNSCKRMVKASFSTMAVAVIRNTGYISEQQPRRDYEFCYTPDNHHSEGGPVLLTRPKRAEP